ncbi:hypothetical protein pCPXV0205 [Cowpox virus]|uniref:Uncharacterized protein n=1 Tax=Cowpox virus TaxID=10243 RepID=A0A212PQN9_COWPX|nr:hypothetical protein pCPXV0205 [Cowpox virus]SNB48497.1 hypothetical protein pCPXV0205 [Cowpox virus]SNB49231.1 hypothetical protein pCPXV0205 [Cowpox virus]SNB52815.1 hypothetical protein pCPXV0205 [Cowpox virus]SNB53890.1 hypothetical protein pCPXV0205 [Cowpox virus]
MITSIVNLCQILLVQRVTSVWRYPVRNIKPANIEKFIHGGVLYVAFLWLFYQPHICDGAFSIFNI